MNYGFVIAHVIYYTNESMIKQRIWFIQDLLNLWNGCTEAGLHSPVCAGSMLPALPPIEIVLDNARVSGRAECNSLRVMLAGPSIVTALAPTSCARGKTVVTIASPRPWASLILANRTTQSHGGKTDDSPTPGTSRPSGVAVLGEAAQIIPPGGGRVDE